MKKKLFSKIAALMVICVSLGGCGQKAEPVSDTVKWINTTYAILTAANEGDIESIGGTTKNESSKEQVVKLLDEWWGVTDRQSADETLNWLLTEGHRVEFTADLAEIKEIGLLDVSREDIIKMNTENNIQVEDGNRLLTVVDAYSKYGEHAIDAWDYCRAIQLLGDYYVADYYTEQETLDKSLEIAKMLQQSYSSWDDLIQSYLYGYQYWQEDDAADQTSGTAQRRAVYDKLKEREDNPYQIDWNLELTKTW